MVETGTMDLVEELIERGFTSYGLTELHRQPDGGDAGVDRLERITRILSKGNQAELQLGQKLLGDWLSRKDSAGSPLYRRLKLRRVLVLKQLQEYGRAIKEAKPLLDEEPESAALQCLFGLLHGWLKTTEGRKTAIQHFERAEELAEDWCEPRLERLEAMFFLGLTEPEYWRQIADSAKATLNNNAAMTLRERLILWTHLATAEALLDPMHIDSDAFAKQNHEAQRIKIPSEQHEDWDLREVYRLVVKVRYSGDAEGSAAVRKELRKLLGQTHRELMPETEWEDE